MEFAEADGSPVAYVISGALYAAYVAAAWRLYGAARISCLRRFPGWHAIVHQRQRRWPDRPWLVVPAPISTKWLSFGSGNRCAGRCDLYRQAIYFSAERYAGGKSSQTFANGAIFGITSGSYVPAKPFIRLASSSQRYLVLGGISSKLGTPTGDDPAVNSAGVQSQNFETGYIDLAAGRDERGGALQPAYARRQSAAPSTCRSRRPGADQPDGIRLRRHPCGFHHRTTELQRAGAPPGSSPGAW